MVKVMFPIPFIELRDYKKKKINNNAFKGELYNYFFIKIREGYFIPISHLPLIHYDKFKGIGIYNSHSWIDFVDRWYSKYVKENLYKQIDNIHYMNDSPKVETIKSVTNYMLRVPTEEDLLVTNALNLNSVSFSRTGTIRSQTMASYYYYLVENGFKLLPLPLKEAHNLLNIELPKLEYFTIIVHTKGVYSFKIPSEKNRLFGHYDSVGSRLTPVIVDYLPDKFKITTMGGLHWEFPKEACYKKYKYLSYDQMNNEVINKIHELQKNIHLIPKYGKIDVAQVIPDFLRKEYIFVIVYLSNTNETPAGNMNIHVELSFCNYPSDNARVLFLKVPMNKVELVKIEYPARILKIDGIDALFTTINFPEIHELPAKGVV